MKLTAYTALIKHLPFEDQSFVTQRSTWEPFKNRAQFSKFYRNMFLDNSVVVLSRADVLSMAQIDPNKAVISTILWGYPRGYTRPNNMVRSFPLFLKHVKYLSEKLTTSKQITIKDIETMLKKCNGIGLSTLSKLLYFFNVSIYNNPCLIMDAKIVAVLSKGTFKELDKLSIVREHNKVKYYAEYVHTCAQLAQKNGYKPDQLELFLFVFGNNLKQQL